MYIQQGIGVGNLLLDLTNYRHGKKPSQKDARDAIIAEQGRKLVKLAEDIVAVGLSPIDLTLVVDANDGNQNFVVVEGNRRLTAIHILLNPELAAGTPIHSAFVKMAKGKADSIPKVINCVVAPAKTDARTWIDRKHANGLEGAGTEQWTAMAKARADVDAGIKRPDLDVVNFVLSDAALDAKVRAILEDGSFNLTTLQRLVTTKELPNAAKMELKDGKLVASAEKKWLLAVLTDLVTSIATGTRGGEKFTERSIDSPQKREVFIEDLVGAHPDKKKASSAWSVTGSPVAVSSKTKAAKATTTKSTASTDDQPNLVPKKFRLALPPGKINDVFVELKTLDVTRYRHSVSVLFRVFVEFTLDAYIKDKTISLPKKNGQPDDRLSTRMSTVVKHMKDNKVLSIKELKPIEVAISDVNSLVAANTLNAYVHSPWMNPEPLQLKLTWANLDLFIATIWAPKNTAGQP